MKHLLVWYPNPAIDHIVTLAHVTRGHVHRVASETYSPGGKGANVLRALSVLGVAAEGITLLGGATGTLYLDLATREGLALQQTRTGGATRTATIIVETSRGEDTVFNGPGPVVSQTEWDAHVEHAKCTIEEQQPKYLVVSGSLPPGGHPQDVADVCSHAAKLGTKVIVDAAGQVLASALQARPWLVKVNKAEAEEVTREGRCSPPSTDDLLPSRLCELGAHFCVVTDGPRTVRAHIGRLRRIQPASVATTSAVGCGDAFLAGALHSLLDGESLDSGLLWGTAIASASAETHLPAMFSRERAMQIRSTLQFRSDVEE